MHLATGSIILAAFAAVYLLALFFESQRRQSRMIQQHPYHSVYDSARGAARGSAVDYDEHTASRHYARGTR